MCPCVILAPFLLRHKDKLASSHLLPLFLVLFTCSRSWHLFSLLVANRACVHLYFCKFCLPSTLASRGQASFKSPAASMLCRFYTHSFLASQLLSSCCRLSVCPFRTFLPEAARLSQCVSCCPCLLPLYMYTFLPSLLPLCCYDFSSP